MVRSRFKLSAEGPPLSGTRRFLTVDVAQARADDVLEALRELVGRLAPHPAILPVIDAGISDHRAFIVTPSVTGQSLDDALGIYGPAALADALPRLQQLADALDQSAADGIIHGALSPQDIIVSPEDTWVVGLGVASALSRAGIHVPLTNSYAAPEVRQGERASAASDQYALAVIGCEWLLGCRFDADAREFPAVSLAGVDTTRLRNLFATATASNPRDRFASCTAFVDAIANSQTQQTGFQGSKVPEFQGSTVPEFQGVEVQRSNVVEFAPVAGELPLFPPEPATASDASALQLAAAGERGSERSPSKRSALVAALVTGVALGAIATWVVVQRAASDNHAQEFTDATVGEAAHAVETEAIAPEVVPPPIPPDPAPEGLHNATVPDATRASQIEAGLLVHSVPAGAMVTVDGKPQGTTPVAIRGLELGTHRVAVSQPGYRPVERQVALTSARPSRAIEIELPPATRTPAASTSAPSAGRLVVDSRPGAASVFIDGRRVGVTPLLLDVATGPHTVRLERDGYRTVTTRVEVKAGERARVAARLEGGQDEE